MVGARAEARLDGSRVYSNGSNTHLASSTDRSTHAQTTGIKLHVGLVSLLSPSINRKRSLKSLPL